MAYSYADLQKIANNPTRVISEILGKIEDSLSESNVTFNSPSHPFAFAIDMITAESWGLLNRSEDAISKLYPYHSRNMSDLGRNMADAQWYGMFANPSTTQMAFVIPTSEIERLAIEYTETEGSVVNTYRKLVIPKDTRIKVVGTYFMVETPIEIRLMDHGGYSVVYDSTQISPFNPISTNILDKTIINNNGTKFLRITVPVRQLNSAAIFNIAVTVGAGLKDTYTYSDSLYGIRAFITNTSGVKSEMAIVYNNQVYDKTKPTLTIDLDTTNSKFTYEVPEVYINEGTGVGTISLLIYTSKGDFEQDLNTIATKDHVPEYLDLNYDNGNLDTYSAPMRDASNVMWKTIQAVSGGSNPRTFSSVREAIIYGSRRDSLPITPNQYSFNIEDYGYSPVKSIEYVTDRLYRVTKDLPKQTNKSFNSGVGVYIGDLLYNLEDLVKTGVVKDNGSRVTIPSKTLISIGSTGNSIVSATTLASIKKLPDDELVDYVKNNRMVYLPVHYVLDATQNQIDLRMYSLDSPKINYQQFLYENTTLNLEVGVATAALVATDTGYLLKVTTTSGSDYKNLDNDEVGLQLTYNPSGTSTHASMKGELIGRTSTNERTYQFTIPSNFDVDSSDKLYLSGFTQFGEVQETNLSDLTTNFSLLFLKNEPDASGTSDSDLKINRNLFSTDFVAVVETTFNISFGQNMDGLYARARAITGDAQYEVYDADVPATYGTNVYKRNANGEMEFDDQGAILVHKATDIILDANGQQLIQHPKGGIKYDNNGNPVQVGIRKLNYHYTIIGFDAVYYFSTDSYDQAYTDSINTYISDIVMKDMTSFTARSLDETRLMFQPTVKMGQNNVVINEGQKASMDLDFSFKVVYYMDKTGFASSDLKTAIRSSTASVINDCLSLDVVSISTIQKQLSTLAGSNVVDVKLDGFLGGTEIDVASREDSSASFSLRKILQLTSEGILSVIEDVTIDFKQHNVKTT